MPDSCRVYVGNLPYDFRDRDLERIFDKYGPMEECVVRSKAGSRSAFGFITFKDDRDADDALKLDGENVAGGRLVVERRRESRPETRHGGSRSTLFIGNLHESVRESELRREFETAGPIKDIRMGFRRSADGRQHAFVDFEDARDAEEAYSRFRDLRFEGLRCRIDFDDGPGGKGKGKGGGGYGGHGDRYHPYGRDDGYGRGGGGRGYDDGYGSRGYRDDRGGGRDYDRDRSYSPRRRRSYSR
uniref:RRM domain-containing protein n=1 Tax=Eutreptiella gymnastica TaxID=73025 RepID=A0A7S1N7C3_9EUGL|mmetsp:Transcript_133217/g.231037  ORF Transcript_133217/g.231037 Transcript_133217/m.231037 type:complete len:243 (+) Transcript_133217:147-875(+)